MNTMTTTTDTTTDTALDLTTQHVIHYLESRECTRQFLCSKLGISDDYLSAVLVRMSENDVQVIEIPDQDTNVLCIAGPETQMYLRAMAIMGRRMAGVMAHSAREEKCARLRRTLRDVRDDLVNSGEDATDTTIRINLEESKMELERYRKEWSLWEIRKIIKAFSPEADDTGNEQPITDNQ